MLVIIIILIIPLKNICEKYIVVPPLLCRHILHFNLIPLSIVSLREQDYSCAISNLRVSTVKSARRDTELLETRDWSRGIAR